MALTPLENGIHEDAERRVWALCTDRSTYALGVTAEGFVLHLYWGPRLTSLDDLPAAILPSARSSQDPLLSEASEEYPPFGGLRYGELAAQVVFADGTRDLDLRFLNAEIRERNKIPCLIFHLRDTNYPLLLNISYSLNCEQDLVIRSATFVNQGDQPISLERAFSGVWHLPRQYGERTLTTLAGRWMQETQIQKRPLVAGTVLLESRRGIPGSIAYPWFAIQSDEEVYFGTLAWSGNWLMRITTTITGATAIAGGIHEHDFTWRLEAGRTFTTPDFVAGFAEDGLNGVRRRLHRYIRTQVLPQSEQPRPVLYNSWEATLFDVNEEGQSTLAERAAQLGVELFVVDDGWFHGRIDDHAGLGDWYVDRQKFPNGLAPLIERVQNLGMQFGIWVEPEMVNPNSALYRAHPDWVYHYSTRPRSESRNQLVLNVARDDVQEYLFNTLNQLLNEHSISFIKWDMNRPISEAGWPDLFQQDGEVRELWVRHTQGVYQLMKRLRAEHPQLSIESCASGGGRADLGILRYTDEVWSSDNTNPEARLHIQEGLSLILPARVMGAWVTDNRARNTIPLSFSFHVAMMGALGVGGNLLYWSEGEMHEAGRWVGVYKEIRHLVQSGEQRWLLSPHREHNAFAAVQYTAQDKSEAVLFAFRRSDSFSETIPLLRLQGLLVTERYELRLLGSQPSPTSQHSGAALLGRGIELPLADTPFASCVLHLKITN